MIVVKVGGAEGNDIDNVLIDLAPRRDYVLVHGGSNEVDRLAEAPRGPAPDITPPSGGVSRKTGKEKMEGVTMGPAGEMKKALVAAGLKAETLILFTNVPGLLREPGDPSTLIPEVPRDRISFFMNFAYGRMKKKLIAAQEALEGGVKRVVIASSQHADPVERALEGMGTVIA